MSSTFDELSFTIKNEFENYKVAVYNDDFNAVIESISSLVNTLNGDKLQPQSYYELYLLVREKLEVFESYLKQYVSSLKDFSEYFTTLHTPKKAIARLYILVTGVSSLCAVDDSNLFYFHDIYKYLCCIQTPVKSLFIYDYYMYKLLPFFKQTTDQQMFQLFYQCIYDMITIWSRISNYDIHTLLSIREKEFNDVKMLIGMSIQRLSSHEKFSPEIYSKDFLPSLLALCSHRNSPELQNYITDALFKIFPAEFHSNNIQQYLTNWLQFNKMFSLKIAINLLKKKLDIKNDEVILEIFYECIYHIISQKEVNFLSLCEALCFMSDICLHVYDYTKYRENLTPPSNTPPDAPKLSSTNDATPVLPGIQQSDTSNTTDTPQQTSNTQDTGGDTPKYVVQLNIHTDKILKILLDSLDIITIKRTATLSHHNMQGCVKVLSSCIHLVGMNILEKDLFLNLFSYVQSSDKIQIHLLNAFSESSYTLDTENIILKFIKFFQKQLETLPVDIEFIKAFLPNIHKIYHVDFQQHFQFLRIFNTQCQLYPTYYNLLLPICYELLKIFQKHQSDEIDNTLILLIEKLPRSFYKIKILCDYILASTYEDKINKAWDIITANYHNFETVLKVRIVKELITTLVIIKSLNINIYKKYITTITQDFINKIPNKLDHVILTILSVHLYFNDKYKDEVFIINTFQSLLKLITKLKTIDQVNPYILLLDTSFYFYSKSCSSIDKQYLKGLMKKIQEYAREKKGKAALLKQVLENKANLL